MSAEGNCISFFRNDELIVFVYLAPDETVELAAENSAGVVVAEEARVRDRQDLQLRLKHEVAERRLWQARLDRTEPHGENP